MNNKQIYESIMKDVSNKVKHYLNEYNVSDIKGTSEDDAKYFELIKKYRNITDEYTKLIDLVNKLEKERKDILKQISKLQKNNISLSDKNISKKVIMSCYLEIIKKLPKLSKLPCIYNINSFSFVFITDKYRLALYLNKKISPLFTYGFSRTNTDDITYLTLSEYLKDHKLLFWAEAISKDELDQYKKYANYYDYQLITIKK